MDIVIASLGLIASFVALAGIRDADYYGVGWMRGEENFVAHEPAWLAWTGPAAEIWMWRELVVMLMNEK